VSLDGLTRVRAHDRNLSGPERVTVSYVAFLRGINVGGRTVRNEQLVDVFRGLGFEQVSAFLASGNVIFQTADTDPDGLEARIEAELGSGLGFEVAAFVRPGAAVLAAAGHAPFPDASEGGKVHIGFLRAAPVAATKKAVTDLARESDQVVFHGREVFWHVAGRFMDSALSDPAVDKALGGEWTVRTANTVQRIAAKLPH
jgi:uncharacterized protein (DUF1697 family)